MKAVPRRLLVLGGGPVGVELAQAVRRFGGEVVLVEGGAHVLPREPAPLGEALGEVLRRDGIELVLGAHATAARRDGDDYVLELDDGSRAARRPPARRYVKAPWQPWPTLATGGRLHLRAAYSTRAILSRSCCAAEDRRSVTTPR